MPPLPKRISRRPPSGRIGDVPIPFDIADVGAETEARGLGFLGRGITDLAQALGAMGEIKIREQKADDLLASDNAGVARQAAIDSYRQFKEDNEDPKLWRAAAKRFRTDADETFSKIPFFDPDRAEREKIRHAAEMNHFEAIVQLQVTDIKAKIAVKATTSSFISAFANDSTDLAAKETALDEALKNEFGDEQLVALEKTKVLIAAEKQKIAVLIARGGFGEAKDLVHASKTLDAEDAIAMLKRIDISEEHLKRKTIDLNNEADMAVNEDFISKIINRDLAPDEVANSRLSDKTPSGTIDKLSKEEWLRYASSSFEDPPEKSTPKGFASASGVVFDYTTFKRQMNKEKAYRFLLDSRYTHKEITDEDFTWAISHINNKYPRHLVTDIEVVTQGNSDSIARGGFLWGLITTDAEEEKARSVNTELIRWIDNEIVQNREPTRQQMYDKSAQLRAQSGKEQIQRIATPKTKADYDKLPSGADYIWPEDGKVYRKK